MEALVAAGLTPSSVLSDRSKEPRKSSSLPTISACKVSNSSNFSSKKQTLKECTSRGLRGGLLLAASVVNGGIANALTYEEALQQSVGIPRGVAVLAIPLVLAQVLKKPQPWGVESAKNVYAKLGADDNAQLLDIRSPVEFRKVGTPDIGGLRKKTVAITYKGNDKPGFLKKLSLKFREPENTTLFILDKFDGNSELVAELVTINGFKAAYAIKDGVEGPRGWLSSGLPWAPPRKGLSLDFGNLADTISGAVGEGSDGLAVTLGIAAAAGLGVLAFSEIETILQLLGSAALVQFASKKLLFAEDRKKTLKQVDEFLNTKIAPQDLADEIKQIGKAFLPASTSNRALPAPTEQNPEPATGDSTVQKAEATPDTISDSKAYAATAPAPEVNSVPKTGVKAESHPGLSKPLSPYPNYPDFKPPTSPTPSQP
ncbi:hypothetical protein L6164_021212 [Bauhinia variegata]|uniref:Uncharacterized protein n=1 Tax=Bauhinia variegata TaxID=167791 RepID=A0ACB9MZ31_BAUVA|nr:hypothetical protein L6164_021212 [Bauhinia variegata]